MELTRSSFNRSCQLLVKAIEISTNQKKIDTISSIDEEFLLSRWRLECTDDKDPYSFYLLHPPVDIISATICGTWNLAPKGGADVCGESILEDKAVSDDTQAVIASALDDCLVSRTTMWSFSIVYSSTYRAPVLYFHVQSLNGNPCGRRDVLEMLRKMMPTANGEIPKETWEFVSQEEHPLSGFPSFFLHPCQSSQRLQLMSMPSSVPRGVPACDDVSPEESSNHDLLWAWMSMILPVVGHSIPSSYYLEIRHFMTELRKHG
jgi:Autophagocytosis associated protein, active-site domain